MLSMIKKEVATKFTQNLLASFKTSKGNTQQIERLYITELRNVLDDLECTYEEAGSQQSIDFRNIRMKKFDEKINIEAKKTDTGRICFNDTFPINQDVNYVFFFTGTKKYEPQVVWYNASLLSNSEHERLTEYKSAINKFKSDLISNLDSVFTFYPRPNIQMDIKSYLKCKPKSLKDLTANELREICDKNSLKTNGSKNALCKRIISNNIEVCIT